MGLLDTLQGHARRQPDKIALSIAPSNALSSAQSNAESSAQFLGLEHIRYGQLWQYVLATSDHLASAGVRPGDRVAWLGLNDPAMLVLLYALARIGAILLPLNYRLAEAELSSITAHAGVTLIIADATHGPIARALAEQGGDVGLLAASSLAQAWQDVRSPLADAQGADGPIETGGASDTRGGGGAGGPIANDAPADYSNAPVLLVYTSGTTGLPKGALHTQAALVANCHLSADAHDFSAQDHVLTVLPMFHVGGLCIQTLPALHAGARVTLHARFDALAWLRDVQNLRPTMSLLVPATLRAVLECSEFGSADLSSLKLLNAGSSAIPASYLDAFHQRGVPVCQVYGATETGPVSIYLKKEDAMARPGCAGRAGEGVQVRLVKPGEHDMVAPLAESDLKPGAHDAGPGSTTKFASTITTTDPNTVTDGSDSLEQIGEMWIRGPNLMSAYWRDPHNAAFQDGWFKSGDLARQDADGFYWVVGRSKDMIISGGENIYPAELENILADCPLIAECAVVGMPDERWGEVAVAVVVVAPGVELTQADVLALFDDKLARFKHPRRVVFEAALPKSALGKVLKQELKNKLRIIIW